MESSSDLHTQTLWQAACGLYAQPGVKTTCLKLQDDHNANVLVILWLCWLEAFKLPLTAEQLNQVMDTANGQAYQQVKDIRQQRKAPPEDTKERLKSQLLNAELTLEQQILEQLEAQSKGFTQANLIKKTSVPSDLPPTSVQSYLAQLQPQPRSALMAEVLSWPLLLLRLP